MALCGLALLHFLILQPNAFRAFKPIPIFICAAAWIIWLCCAALWSSMPLVSLKYVLVESVHCILFLPGLFLLHEHWDKLLKPFCLSMSVVILYTLIHHGFYHFRADQALLAPMPFFPENNLYAAVIALLIPWMFFDTRIFKRSGLKTGMIILFCGALFLSFSRTALLSSALVGFLVFVIWWLSTQRKNRLLSLGMIIGTVLIVIPFLQPLLVQKLNRDVSVLERINRYHCAARMLSERPWTGFGPGTFADQYFPFQKAEEMTRISLSAPISGRNPATYGRGGGAHSEYWQTLAETGIPGFMVLVLLVLLLLGFTWNYRNQLAEPRVLCCLCSLGIFMLLGLANNFMHDGRIAALVWGQIALLSSCFTRISEHQASLEP